MKTFLQVGISVALGACLVYEYYQNTSDQKKTVQASIVEVDSLFLADEAAFIKKQQASLLVADSSSSKPLLTQVVYPESIPVPTPAPVAANKVIQTPALQVKPKIEVYEIKKQNSGDSGKKSNSAPALPDVASAQPTKNSGEVRLPDVAGTITTAPAVEQQPQTERKKGFLFFNKKNKSKQ